MMILTVVVMVVIFKFRLIAHSSSQHSGFAENKTKKTLSARPNPQQDSRRAESWGWGQVGARGLGIVAVEGNAQPNGVRATTKMTPTVED